MSKVAVAASGGIDSTVLAYDTVAEYGKENVILLYGSMGRGNSNISYDNVAYLSRKLKVKSHSIRISTTTIQEVCSSEVFNHGSSDRPVTGQNTSKKSYREHSEWFMRNYVPGLYTLLWVQLGAVATCLGCESLSIGLIKTNRSHEKGSVAEFDMDSGSNFVQRLNALRRSIWGPNATFIELPFIDKTKKQVVAIGKSYGVDFSRTTSCWREPSCGSCYECFLRKEALNA